MDSFGAVAVPGETLYSLGRHVFVTEPSLFGHLSQSVIGGPLLHSVTIPIAQFCMCTSNRYGNPTELRRTRTPINYFSASCSQRLIGRLEQRLENGGDVRYSVPRLGSPVFLQRTPEMRCSECAALVESLFGRDATLLTHVLPLVEVCSLHGLPLLPGSSQTRADLLSRDAGHRANALTFASLSVSLLTPAEDARPDGNAVRDNIVRMLREASYIDAEGIHAHQLDVDYTKYFLSAPVDRRLKTLAGQEHRARKTLYACLSPNSSQHPVLQILLAMFLQETSRDSYAVLHGPFRERIKKRRQVVKPCRRERSGAAAVAKAPGCGESPSARRERTRGGRRIYELLRRNLTPKAVARILGTPVDAIYYYIRHHGLWNEIKTRRLAGLQERYRRHWTELLAHHPELGVTALRKRSPRTYGWLFRNDRDWMHANRKPTPSYSSTAKHHARPYGQDYVVARRVHDVGVAIRRATPPVRCTGARIRRASGITEYAFNEALRWKRVSAAFLTALESRSEYAERRRKIGR
jgi:hypothetical protein